MKEIIDVAITAAQEAGVLHLRYLNKDARVRTKRGTFDLVTRTDLEAEEKIVAIIRNRFPDHNFLAEENKYGRTDSEYTWIIDPLDGTNNFAFGLPIFCVSIGLSRADELIAGVVYDASRNELFQAQKGGGAFLNANRIAVSPAARLEESMLITGFYYDRGSAMIDTLERIKKFLQYPVVGVRRLGAAALDLCYVACGRATGFWEFELSPWDFAAGTLIIREAGGMVTGKRGETVALEKSYIVASNGKIHAPMLEILA